MRGARPGKPGRQTAGASSRTPHEARRDCSKELENGGWARGRSVVVSARKPVVLGGKTLNFVAAALAPRRDRHPEAAVAAEPVLLP